MVYKGSKPDSEKELLNTMIGIYNKKTGKVRLVSCEHWELAPVLGKITQTRTDFHDGAIAALSKEFGSKKVKRRTEQYEKMQIDIDSVKEKLESIVAGMKTEFFYFCRLQIINYFIFYIYFVVFCKHF